MYFKTERLAVAASQGLSDTERIRGRTPSHVFTKELADTGRMHATSSTTMPVCIYIYVLMMM